MRRSLKPLDAPLLGWAPTPIPSGLRSMQLSLLLRGRKKTSTVHGLRNPSRLQSSISLHISTTKEILRIIGDSRRELKPLRSDNHFDSDLQTKLHIIQSLVNNSGEKHPSPQASGRGHDTRSMRSATKTMNDKESTATFRDRLWFGQGHREPDPVPMSVRAKSPEDPKQMQRKRTGPKTP